MTLESLLLCLLTLPISWSMDPANYPHILSENENLIIRPAKNRNLTLDTNGEMSFIFLGDINLSHLLDTVQMASKTVEHLETIIIDEMDGKYQNLMTGRRGILRRLQTLENIKSIKPYDFLNIIKVHLRDISTRLTNLENFLDKNECASAPCKNGGKCIESNKKFLCLCPETWQGYDCSVDVNECDRFAATDLGCQNGATCINKNGGYQCICAPRWHGIHCTKNSIYCDSNSNSNNEICGHGVCIEGSTNNNYTCLCDQGWETNGHTPECTVDVNECLTARHHCSPQPYVPCINVPGSFYCGSCPTGYSGNGYVCNDIDECSINNGGCSTSPLVRCINTLGSRMCDHCPPGYIGDGTTCTFKGVCLVNSGGCHPLATCSDNPSISSTYVVCICAAGYTGTGYGVNGCVASPGITQDGVTELVPLQCNPNPCVHGRCVDMPSGRICICDVGYMGRLCDTIDNPCATQPCKNGGTCIRDVTKDEGFRCECISEYTAPRCVDKMIWCGGVIDAEEGSIVYPEVNSTTYKHNIRCAWVIQTKPNKILNVTFTKFNLEHSADCLYDWVQIHDGRNTADHVIGRFCGNTLPRGGNIVSTTNYLYIWFRTDHTVAHRGFNLHWVSSIPVCGGTIESSTYGIIRSPGSPGKYPPNRDCYWAITTSSSMRIQIHFFTLQIESHPDCKFDFLEIRDGILPRDPLLAKYCNSTNPAPLLSTGNKLLIYFHSDPLRNDYGFQLTYTIVGGIPGCGGTYTGDMGEIKPPTIKGNYANNVMCEYKIKRPKGTQLTITFLMFELEESSTCRFDYVAIYDGSSERDNLIGRYCGNNLPTPFTSSSNNVLIVFKSDSSFATKGFRIRYEMVCNQVMTALSGTFMSPGHPKPYSGGIRCTYLLSLPEGKAIALSFVEFDIEEGSYPDCKYDGVKVFDGDNENSTQLGKFCGSISVKPDDLVSSLNYLYLEFITDESMGGSGFVASYTSVDIDCGSVLKNTAGTIMIPDPDNDFEYRNNLSCQWVISVPPGHIVQLTWSWIHLDFDHDCPKDHVEVFENNTLTKQAVKLGRFCGFDVPPILTSMSNLVTIIFNSNNYTTYKGFTLSYNQFDGNKECGGDYLSSFGTITSPGWPLRYPGRKDCIWTIRASVGQQIMLNFKEIHIRAEINEEDKECLFDYLEIRNGVDSAAPLISRFCGSVLPTAISSFANNIYLHFHSLQSRLGGFRLTWDSTATGCGGMLNSPKGSIISPNYPQSYGMNMECYWKISTSAGSRIKLVFADLQLGSNCSYDYVEIFESPNKEEKSLGKFCNMKMYPVVITSTLNHVFVKFHSGLFIEGTGFSLKYYTVCNVTLTGYNGVIESPNFPNSYLDAYDCFWRIIVPKGNKIKIIFSNFELQDVGEQHMFSSHKSSLENGKKSCSYDYIEILTETEQRLNKRFCGKKLPPKYTSNDNQVFIHFRTDGFIGSSGFRLEWLIQGCGGKIFKSKGELTTPDFPISYPNDTECTWDIEVVPYMSIQLEVEEIDLEFAENCTADSLTVYNGQDAQSPLLTKVCHKDQKNIVVTSTGNYMHIHFISDGQYSGKGFKAHFTSVSSECGGQFSSSYGKIQSPNYPLNYFSDAHCYWLISVLENHRALISLDDFDLLNPSNGNCTDVVKIYDGNKTDENKMISKDLCGNNLNQTTFISSSNQILVEMISRNGTGAKGFQATYSLSCGSTITAETEGILKIDGDLMVGQKLNSCVWTIIGDEIKDKIALTFMYVSIVRNLKIKGPQCGDTKIVVYNGESVTSPVIQEICDNKVPPTTLSDGNAITIELQNGRGLVQQIFEVHYSTLSNACGGDLKSEHGTFTSPMYPSSYPLNAQCIWTLKPSPGNQVRLAILKFDFEDSENCDEDYLEIREDSGIGKVLGIYCGDTLPTNTTIGSNLWIKFKSNSDGAHSGFVADYSYIHGNELSGEAGIIASPMYPKPYMQKLSEDFSWRITVSFGSSISLVFNELKMASYDYCEDLNSVVMYDGFDDKAPVLITACGHDLPEPVESTSNIAYILFRNSGGSMGSLFRLEWTQVTRMTDVELSSWNTFNSTCGRKDIVFLPISAVISLTSPGFPEGYASNLKCQWVFETDPTHHIGLRFLTLNLENSINCLADSVIISTTSIDNPNDWIQLDKYCLNNATEFIVDGNSKLKVEFHTDLSGNGTGFNALVFSVCGSHLTSPTEILSPSFPNNTQYTIFQNIRRQISCVWTIAVKPGRTINLEFLEINGSDPEPKECRNYIMIKNGGSDDSPLLGNGKYCGDYLPNVTLQTNGNRLYVKYNSVYIYPAPLSFQSIFNFKIKYWEVSLECEYRLKLTDSIRNTTISSPNYPNIPKPYTECIWVIMAPAGERIKVDFIEKIDLTPDDRCELEYVELRDGGTKDSLPIGKFCGTTPGTKKSTSNIMYIKFLTDVPDPKNGFKAVVSIDLCGGTIYNRRGYISMRKNLFMANQNNEIECIWNIVGIPGESKWININKLFLPESKNCTESYLEVMELNPINSSDYWVTDRICSLTKPILIQMSSKSIRLKLFFEKKSMKTLNYTMGVSFDTFMTNCGGLHKTPEGVLNGPRYFPNNARDQFCVWEILVPQGRRITLEIISGIGQPPMNESELRLFISNDYNSNSQIYTNFENTTNRIVESSSNKMMVSYGLKTNRNYEQFQAKYTSDKETVCNGDFSKMSGIISSPTVSLGPYYCEYEHTMSYSTLPIANTFRSNSDYTLAITLSKLAIGKNFGSFCGSRMSQISIVEEFRYLSEDFCGNYTDPITIRSNTQRTSILISDDGKGSYQINYKVNPCGGIINNVDSSYRMIIPVILNGSIDCAWVFLPPEGYKLEVNTTGLKLTGDCNSEFVIVRRGFFRTKNSFEKLCANNMTAPIVTPHKQMVWVEYSADRYYNESKLGWQLNVLSEGCGGILQFDKSFSTPKYPSSYGENEECTWEIEAKYGFRVSLNFIDRFAIEKSPNCSKDFVEIFDLIHKNWISMGKFCGREISGPFNSTSNKMKVIFRSDSSINGDGFKAHWNTICGGTMYAEITPKDIISPGYPMYEANLNCVYEIIAPPGKFVQLEFEHFSLEYADQNNKCDVVKLTLETYNDNFIDSFESQTFCGENSPGRLRFKNGVKLTFITDEKSEKTEQLGFILSYNIDTCGGNINSSQQISSPNNDKNEYHPELNCVWNITAPPDKVVIVRFQSFVMEMMENCDYDYVAAYEGKEISEDSKLARLCGNLTESLPVIKSKTNNMVLHLETDTIIQYSGFVADVYFMLGESHGCGGTFNVNKTNDYVLKINKDLLYKPNMECHWLIRGPMFEKLHVVFDSFHVAPCLNVNQTALRRNNCTCDYVEIRDGTGHSSPLIGRYCGHSMPSNLMSYKNSLWIRFVADGTVESAGVQMIISSKLSPCRRSFLTVGYNTLKQLNSPLNSDGFLPAGISCLWKIRSDDTSNIHLKFLNFELSPPSQDNQCLESRLEISKLYLSQKFRRVPTFVRRSLLLFMFYKNHFKFEPDAVTHVYCGSMNLSDYYIDADLITIKLITSANMENKYKGFQLEYDNGSNRSNYTAPHGRILMSVENSRTIIITTTPNRWISMYFNTSKIPYSKLNYLEIRDGLHNDSVLLDKIESARTPLPVFSTGNTLRLDLFKNSHLVEFWLNAYYFSTDQGRGCGGSVTSISGTLSSPLYPFPYRTAGKCEWTIETPIETIVSVKFKVFDFGMENTCEFNYVELINHKGVVIVKYCPGDSPASRQSDNNYLKIVQSSSPNNKGSGWLLYFESNTA
ncbi:cubilin-like [Arctopsyche grandis]|uniref:cubilin-like n=1 Tax=Arctopsyche grandis TaxID=121162 RepID=UPI00406D7074